jgi:hypothetical protein
LTVRRPCLYNQKVVDSYSQRPALQAWLFFCDGMDSGGRKRFTIMWGKKIRKDESMYPSADVPLPPNEPMPPTGNTYRADPVVENAKHRMADEMERGHTPYNFAGEIKNGGGIGLSPVATASAVALIATLAIGFFAWKFLSGVSGKMDNLGRNMAAISSQLQSDKEAQEVTGRAVVRSELRKTLIALDAAIALGDPAITSQAVKLRDEVKHMLGSIEGVAPRPMGAGQASSSSALDTSGAAKAEVSAIPPSVTPVPTPVNQKPPTGAGAVGVAEQAPTPSAGASENVQR